MSVVQDQLRTQLVGVIAGAFNRAEDVIFEEGRCTHWAVGFYRYVVDELKTDAVFYVAYEEGDWLSHAAVFVPNCNTVFDWRGADVEKRWRGWFHGPLQWREIPWDDRSKAPPVNIGDDGTGVEGAGPDDVFERLKQAYTFL